MKKSILNLGKALNKAEQKLINGGARSGGTCHTNIANDCGGACFLCEPINWYSTEGICVNICEL